MLRRFTKLVALMALAGLAPLTSGTAVAKSQVKFARELPPYLQCVPYARQQSGVSIYGDAHTWWGQAKGKFKRGSRPKVGAVMAFQPHRNMKLGHVAAVSKVVDRRTILLRHSNWSPIDGRRGQIENDVRAIDVSPNNDWSQVRVWYDPIKALGKTAWPIHGFIYSDMAPKFETPSFRAPQPKMKIARAPVRQSVSKAPSRGFTNAFSNLSARMKGKPTRVAQPAPKRTAAVRPAARQTSVNSRVNYAVSLYD